MQRNTPTRIPLKLPISTKIKKQNSRTKHLNFSVSLPMSLCFFTLFESISPHPFSFLLQVLPLACQLLTVFFPKQLFVFFFDLEPYLC